MRDLFDSIRLVIYDMDGLLIDSEPFWRQAEIKVFGTVGVELTEADCKATTGFRFDEVVEHWYHRQPWTHKSIQQVHDEVLDEMERAILHQAQPMPGVIESLEFFAQHHKRMALASSSAMRLIKATVHKLGIEKYFDGILSAEHETYGKPHPAVFIRTAHTLQVREEHCLVLEDSFNGVLAAKAARMKCIAVPDKDHYADARFAIADARVPSLLHLPSLLR